MSSLQVNLNKHGNNSGSQQVKLEVLDAQLNLVADAWTSVDAGGSFKLADGLYGVRATMPSGATVQRAVQVAGPTRVALDASHLSPHESHEWAYFGSAYTPQSSRKLDEDTFRSTWVQLWRREPDSAWVRIRFDTGDQATWAADGVQYEFRLSPVQHYLQIGGPAVPWRCVALPPAHELRVLLRPAAVAEADGKCVGYPIDIVVASANAEVEAITTLLARGKVGLATELMDKAHIAEAMLAGKVGDPSAAAVGAYYLLRVGALDRLHDWTLNLANWIDWMPDGAVIRAWHVAATHRGKRLQDLPEARRELLRAHARGTPIYAEGLRLLTMGLRQLEQENPNDFEVAQAKRTVEQYYVASEPGMPTTTFDGSGPNDPLIDGPTGVPTERSKLVFVYDVGWEEMLASGFVKPGVELRVAVSEDRYESAFVNDEGRLAVKGQLFDNLRQAAKALGAKPSAPLWDWKDASDGFSLDDIQWGLRRGLIQPNQQSEGEQAGMGT